MMKRVNGVTMPPNISPKISDSSVSDEGNFPSEDNFRGFEKVPIVLCEKLDLTKFSNSFNQHHKSKQNHETSDHVVKLLKECKVVIVRDDLEYLLKVFKEKTKNNVLISSHYEKTYKCLICDKVYSSENKMRNHQENKHILLVSQPNVVKNQKRVSFSDHVIIHEVKEYHRCRKCTKIFDDYKSLKTHMKQVHKKRKCYVCFYCSKDFVDRMFFKVHVRLHCDRCGKLLPSKKEFSEHQRNVCKVIKKYKCKYCNEIFFSFMGLKDHSYQHTGLVYVCDVCKEWFSSKCAVEHHIIYLHTIKHPHALYNTTEIEDSMLYECNFCDKRSIHQDVLEKHVSSLPDLLNRRTTSYKDYYFCDNCSKQFETETDILQHKWTHFLKKTSSQTENKGVPELKQVYNINEELPLFLQPKVVLEKISLPKIVPVLNNKALEFIDLTKSMDNLTLLPAINKLSLKKPIMDPVKKKKTILSNHHCDNCGKYYSTNYCLTRHKLARNGMCSGFKSTQCNVCEENFACTALLRSHTCIRMTIPEMPFDDARPEIHFDNTNYYKQNAMNVAEDDYMDSVDFNIAAPIVQLTEYDNIDIVVNGGSGHVNFVQSGHVNVAPSVNEHVNLVQSGNGDVNSVFSGNGPANLLDSGNGRGNLLHGENGHANIFRSGNGHVSLVHIGNGLLNVVHSGNGHVNLVHNANEQANLVSTGKICVGSVDPIQNLGYNVIMQEVPIEF